MPVRVVEGTRHGRRDRDALLDRQLPLPTQFVSEGLSLRIRHHEVEKRVCLTGVMERQDLGMLEVGGDFDLFQEPLGTEDGGELGPEDLEGDLAVMFEVLGEIDGRHPAVAQLPLDTVAGRERGREAFEL